MFEVEGKEAAALLGVDQAIEILTDDARKQIEQAVELMAESYNQSARDKLKKTLAKQLAEGATFPEIKEAVQGIYAFQNETAAARVARTETFRVGNLATKQAWKQSGGVKTIKWYTAADERVCPWCAPMHGKVVGIEENFFEKGDSHTGEDGKVLDIDYADVGAPPLHTNCRCYSRPEDINFNF